MARYAQSPTGCVDENLASDVLQGRLSVDSEAAIAQAQPHIEKSLALDERTVRAFCDTS